MGRHRQSGGDCLGCFDGLRLNEAQISLRLRNRVHWHVQSPIHAATRLEANRASLFKSLRVVAAHPVEAALQFAGVPAAYLLAGRPHPIAELGHAERRRVHVESLLH